MSQVLHPTAEPVAPSTAPTAMNWALFSAVFTIASGTTIGILMAIALIIGFDEIPHIIGVCIAGFFLAMPIAFIVAKKMQSLGITKN